MRIARIARIASGGLLVVAFGCGGHDEPLCARADGDLTADISCAEAEEAVRYAETLAARGLTATQRQRLLAALERDATADPAALEAKLAEAHTFVATLATRPPLRQAEERSTHLFDVAHDGGVFPTGAYPTVADVVREAVAVWSSDDHERLVLTEMDVEGWLRYASLAREVQGGGPLKLSVADRVGGYRIVQDRWRSLDRAGKIALSAVGPFWPDVRARWAAATYDEQQAWARAAPLPPPMTASSLGYLEAFTKGDVARLVSALHAHLGPLRMGVIR